MTTCTGSFPLLTVGPLQLPAGMVGCVAPVFFVGPDQRETRYREGQPVLSSVLTLLPAVRPAPPVCSLDSVPLQIELAPSF